MRLRARVQLHGAATTYYLLPATANTAGLGIPK